MEVSDFGLDDIVTIFGGERSIKQIWVFLRPDGQSEANFPASGSYVALG